MGRGRDSAEPNNDPNEFTSDSCIRHDTIHSNLVHKLYTRGPEGYSGALLGAAILVVSLWNQSPRMDLGLWLAFYTLINLSRRMLVIRYFKVGVEAADPLIWERRFAGGTIAGGVLWG